MAAKKKKKPLSLDEVAQEVTNKLEPAMNALGGLSKPKGKKPKKLDKSVGSLDDFVKELNELAGVSKKPKKPKPVAIAPDNTWTGSGWGSRQLRQ